MGAQTSTIPTNVRVLVAGGSHAHATSDEAKAYAKRIHLEVYRDFLERELALPVHVGRKTVRERFAGAVNTLTCEALMADGKSLQIATSHELGQNFSRAFDISYLDRDKARKNVWTTSWGSSTRMLGGLIMGHGDNRGLRVPPSVAPIQAVVVPVRDSPEVLTASDKIRTDLGRVGVRVEADLRPGRYGRKVIDWELKGVPLRIEIGPRELEVGLVTIILRNDQKKLSVRLADLPKVVSDALQDVQRDLFEEAQGRLQECTPDVNSLAEAIDAGRVGLARLPWWHVAGPGEDRLSEHTLTVRCVQRADGSIPESDDESDLYAIVGRSY